MKLNLLGINAVDLEGKPLPGGIMSNVVSEMLISSRGGQDPVKLYELAVKIKKGENDLDFSDLDMIEKVVETHENYFPLIKGQILLEIRKQRREGKK